MADLSRWSRILSKDGVCVIPDVLSGDETRKLRERLIAACQETVRRGIPLHLERLDPNAANIRVFNLLDLDQAFRDLIMHPLATALVGDLLGACWMISNFTANIALPGSKSMAAHSDQALVVPEPWLKPWSINIIWCLDDADEENGATLYLPGSHLCKSREELPEKMLPEMIPFEATAGSIVAMDGRVWHSSGANVSQNRERALLFGYYSVDFIRPQVNWNALLSGETQRMIDRPLFDRLGLGPDANIRVGNQLIKEQHLDSGFSQTR